MDTKAVFSDIYEQGKWKGTSKSGPGSSLDVTAPLREALPGLFSDLDIRTLIDAPCGTAEWITEVTGGLDVYLGFDIVEQLIRTANDQNDRRNHFFMVADLIETVLPKADAILCRDCLVHMPLDAATNAISNFMKSGSRYLLATTFPTVAENIPARMGTWRPLNLQIAPFNFPQPVRLLRDRLIKPGDKYADKSIGVWEIGR